MNKAEEYFKANVIWNGTVIMNPIDLIEGYHQSRVKNIISRVNSNAFFKEDVKLTLTKMIETNY